jgi:hypothetical protein
MSAKFVQRSSKDKFGNSSRVAMPSLLSEPFVPQPPSLNPSMALPSGWASYCAWAHKQFEHDDGPGSVESEKILAAVAGGHS